MNIISLLSEYRVVIPSIQRGYAHGDDTAKAREVRVDFIDKVFGLIGDESKKFCLDLIYGVSSDGTLELVDGQQRVTTLWLVYVYLVQNFCPQDLRGEYARSLFRFSYCGRPLAEAFCQGLALSLATNQAIRNWLDLYPKCDMAMDGTVKAMCRTWETISSKFNGKFCNKNRSDAWVLCKSALERVVFEFEKLDDLGVTASDMYEKINARGKMLTNWENFKGKFSEQLGCMKDVFDREIEELSDLYFERFREIPDESFFALFGRVIDYNKCKRNPDYNADKSPCLTALAKGEKVSYVPLEELQLSNLASVVVLPVLRMMRWALSMPLDGCSRLWYWQEEGSVAQALFMPENEDERDFSLVLFEYFQRYDLGMERLLDCQHRAIKLIANILENVSRDRMMKVGEKNYSSMSRFNRIVLLKRFMDVPYLYRLGRTLTRKEPLQYDEECLKGDFYAEGDGDVDLLDEVERLLHGRARIALVDLETWRLASSDEFGRRASCLRDKAKNLTVSSSETRWNALCSLVKCLPWDIGWDHIPINLSEAWRNILTSRFDADLQKSFIDGGLPVGQELLPFERDWRKTIAFAGADMMTNDKAKWHVRWHGWSGAYYLYTMTNNGGAYPIGDYRIDWYDQGADLRQATEQLADKITDMRMSAAGEKWVKLCNDVWVFLYKEHCSVVIANTRCDVRYGMITDKQFGWIRFITGVDRCSRNKLEALKNVCENNDAKAVLDLLPTD